MEIINEKIESLTKEFEDNFGEKIDAEAILEDFI